VLIAVGELPVGSGSLLVLIFKLLICLANVQLASAAGNLSLAFCLS
jgi:hypothetical protein